MNLQFLIPLLSRGRVHIKAFLILDATKYQLGMIMIYSQTSATDDSVNLFSSKGFLHALAETYFPEVSTNIHDFSLDGHCWRSLALSDGTLITDWFSLDFFEPLGNAGPDTPHAGAKYLPRVALGTVPVGEHAELYGGHPESLPAPYIRWDRFSDYRDIFQQSHYPQKSARELARRRRKLEREVGPLKLVSDSNSAALLHQLVKWKVEQMLVQDTPTEFVKPVNQAFLGKLVDRGVAHVNVLQAGGMPIAIALGARLGGRYYLWNTGYDPRFSKYGTGLLLLESLLEISHAAGDCEFDFLIGDEEYKWRYATDVRVIQSLGEAPFYLRVRKGVKSVLRPLKTKSPQVWAGVKKLARMLPTRTPGSANQDPLP